MSFYIYDTQLITFLFHNTTNKLFSINKEKNNNKIIFITNIVSKNNHIKYTQSLLYILFDKYKELIELKDIYFEVRELENKVLP